MTGRWQGGEPTIVNDLDPDANWKQIMMVGNTMMMPDKSKPRSLLRTNGDVSQTRRWFDDWQQLWAALTRSREITKFLPHSTQLNTTHTQAYKAHKKRCKDTKHKHVIKSILSVVFMCMCVCKCMCMCNISVLSKKRETGMIKWMITEPTEVKMVSPPYQGVVCTVPPPG